MGEKDAEGLARAESREGSGRWGGWTGRRGDGEGWMAMGRGRQEGGIWKWAMRRGAIGTGRGWQWGGGQREEEMERGAMARGRGAMGKGRWGGGNRTGEKKVQEERGFHRYDEMPGWNEVTEFSDFVYPCNAGYPS